MSTARWSIDRWHDLFRMVFRPEHVAFFPHKIFRWDAEGIYRDCFFPFKCQHLLGGENILGKSINEVLPKQARPIFKKAFGLTQRRGLPQNVQCVIPGGEQSYVASIRLFPFDAEVLGLVTDHDLSGAPVIKVTADHPSMGFLRRLPDSWPQIASLSRKNITQRSS